MSINEQELFEIADSLNANLKLKKPKKGFGPKEPIFADFFYQHPESMRDYPSRLRDGDELPSIAHDPNELGYVPVPHSGGRHGGPVYDEDSWYGWYAIEHANIRAAAGEPIAIMIRNYNCPFPYGDDVAERGQPDAFAKALENLPQLDYVLMDMEGGEDERPLIEQNLREIHRMVRNHPDPKKNKARLGNYNYTGVEYDEAMIWPNRRDTRNRWPDHDPVDIYHNYLDVSMPVCYPYATASQHLSTYTQGDNVAPNGRAAIFWQALERFSAAAKVLPEGHYLIPWVGEYIYNRNPNYNAPRPSDQDNIALMFHFRMRGAYSFYSFAQSFQREYVELAVDAWNFLNPLYRLPIEREIMNLDTNKLTGFNWSGVKMGNHRLYLFSNLSDQDADLGPYKVLAGEHKFVVDNKVFDVPDTL